MQWLADYWWIILLILAGMIISGIKELRRVDVKRYLADKPELPPHRDNNAQWDDEDDNWPNLNRLCAPSPEGGASFSPLSRRKKNRLLKKLPLDLTLIG
ncbi:hypothetical protein ALQ63_00865 [Serratia plymuthica]|nr:hypothetical protein ALQ63_00865 [Serratia plymuthica]